MPGLHLPRPSYPRRQELRRLMRVAAAAGIGGAAVACALLAADAGLTVIAMALLAVACVLGLYARRWARLVGRAPVGARSEAEVRRTLAGLEREGWRLHHSVGWHRGDIDHIAVAPTGVAFAIETKTRRYEPRHVHTVRAQAAWLQRRRRRWCPGGALPILCVTRGGRLQAAELDVLVVSLDQLLPALRIAARTISPPRFLARTGI